MPLPPGSRPILHSIDANLAPQPLFTIILNPQQCTVNHSIQVHHQQKQQMQKIWEFQTDPPVNQNQNTYHCRYCCFFTNVFLIFIQNTLIQTICATVPNHFLNVKNKKNPVSQKKLKIITKMISKSNYSIQKQ